MVRSIERMACVQSADVRHLAYIVLMWMRVKTTKRRDDYTYLKSRHNNNIMKAVNIHRVTEMMETIAHSSTAFALFHSRSPPLPSPHTHPDSRLDSRASSDMAFPYNSNWESPNPLLRSISSLSSSPRWSVRIFYFVCVRFSLRRVSLVILDSGGVITNIYCNILFLDARRSFFFFRCFIRSICLCMCWL